MIPLKDSPKIAELLRKAVARGPMTAAQIRAQCISWTYGNCGIENPNLTREMVADIYDKMYGKPER